MGMMAGTVLCFISVIGGSLKTLKLTFLYELFGITLWNRELVIYQTLGVYNTHSGLLHITPLQRPGCY